MSVVLFFFTIRHPPSATRLWTLFPYTTLFRSHRVIAVPTIGSSVRWNITRDWSFTGQATAQTLNVGSSLMGFNAQTDWRISDRVGLVAGYQLLKSEFDLGVVTTDLSQEGLFARLSIQF